MNKGDYSHKSSEVEVTINGKIMRFRLESREGCLFLFGNYDWIVLTINPNGDFARFAGFPSGFGLRIDGIGRIELE